MESGNIKEEQGKYLEGKQRSNCFTSHKTFPPHIPLLEIPFSTGDWKENWKVNYFKHSFITNVLLVRI